MGDRLTGTEGKVEASACCIVVDFNTMKQQLRREAQFNRSPRLLYST